MTGPHDPQAVRALAAGVLGQAVRDLGDPEERWSAARFFQDDGGAFSLYAAVLDLDPDVIRERAFGYLVDHVGEVEAARLWRLAARRRRKRAA